MKHTKIARMLLASSLLLASAQIVFANESASSDKNGGRSTHGFLKVQEDWVNHWLHMGGDMPPDEAIPPSKVPHTQNDFLLIRKKAKEAIEKNPRDAGAYLDLGYASGNLNQYQTDLDCCNKSIELDPSVAVAYAERGIAYEGLGHYEEALENFDKAISLDPKNSAFYSHKGRLYARQGAYRNAIDELTKSIEIYAGYSPAFYYRGRCHLRLDEYEKAIADFSEAIKLYPHEEIWYYVERAYAQVQLDAYDKALDDLRVAVKDDPNEFPRALDVAFRGGKSDNTVEARDRVLELAKELTTSKPYSQLSQRALFDRFLRNYVVAIKEFDDAIKQNPAVGELYRMRGSTYFDMHEFSKARDDLTKAIELNQTDADAYKYRATVCMDQRDFPNAILDTTQLIKIRPDKSAYMMRGAAYRALGQMDKAAEDMRNFIGVAQQSYAEKNLPNKAEFDKLLQRDLDKQFSEKLGKTVHIEYDPIQAKLSPIDTFGPPRSFLWLRIKSDAGLIDQGPVGVVAFNKQRFLVQCFLGINEIKKDPHIVYNFFPVPISKEIFQRAGVAPLPTYPVVVPDSR